MNCFTADNFIPVKYKIILIRNSVWRLINFFIIFVIGNKIDNKIMQVKMLKPAVGRILISEPFLSDMYFQRSVVLMVDHSSDGSFGIILNKPVESFVCDIVDGFHGIKSKIFLGGPVRSDALFFIHRLGRKIRGSVIIYNDIAWGGDVGQVKEMIKKGEIKEKDIRFFLGYSGWTKNQLDDELKHNSWVVSDKKIDTVIDVEPENMWEYSLKQLSGNYKEWINYPKDPTNN